MSAFCPESGRSWVNVLMTPHRSQDACELCFRHVRRTWKRLKESTSNTTHSHEERWPGGGGGGLDRRLHAPPRGATPPRGAAPRGEPVGAGSRARPLRVPPHFSVSPDTVSGPGRVRHSGLAPGSWSCALISARSPSPGFHGSVAPGDPQWPMLLPSERSVTVVHLPDDGPGPPGAEQGAQGDPPGK